MDDLGLAEHNAEKIIVHLATGGTLNGTDEPLRVYFQCFRLLEKIQDPRSAQVLQDAIEMLESQVSKLKDEDSRKMYVENVPWRLALSKAATKQSR